MKKQWLGVGLAAMLVWGAHAHAQTAKQPIRGLVAMGDVSFAWKGGTPSQAMSEINRHPGVYAGAVINVKWAQIEPAEGRFDFGAIDEGLKAIASYNQHHAATPVTGKLRVHTANGTPAWALAIGGVKGGVPIGTKHEGQVGAYWSAETGAAWTKLQEALAAKYDADPRIAEVTIESCSSTGGEPFRTAVDIESLTNMRRLTPAFSDAQAEACFRRAPKEYAAWKRTLLDYTFNQFQATDGCTAAKPTGCVVMNPKIATEIMESFRAEYGARAVLANHDLAGELPSALMTFYPEIQKLGGAVEYQTLNTGLSYGEMCASLNTGMAYGMTEFELHETKEAGGGGSPLGMGELMRLREQFKGGKAVDCR